MKHGIAQARPHQPLSVEDERIFNHARRMEGPFSTEERLNKVGIPNFKSQYRPG